MFSSLFRLYPIALSVILFLTSSCPITCTVFSCFCCLSTPNGGSTVCDLFCILLVLLVFPFFVLLFLLVHCRILLYFLLRILYINLLMGIDSSLCCSILFLSCWVVLFWCFLFYMSFDSIILYLRDRDMCLFQSCT